MALFQSFNLTNADLDAQYCKTFTHNKNTTAIQLEWWDNNGVLATASGVFDIIDENSFSICTGAPITGTHNIKMIYSDAQFAGGTRLFADLPFDTDFLNQAFDTDSLNIAYGNDTGSFNVTLTDFIDKCKTLSGGDMVGANNLSDVVSVATARSNLSVFSKSEVDAKFLPSQITLPAFWDIGTWDLQVLAYSFMGATPGIQNVIYGTIDISFVLTPENSVIKEGEWVTLFRVAPEVIPYATHQFFAHTSSGELCMCRILGSVFFDESTLQIGSVASGDKGKMQVWFVDQVELPYYFNIFYHVGNYNG